MAAWHRMVCPHLAHEHDCTARLCSHAIAAWLRGISRILATRRRHEAATGHAQYRTTRALRRSFLAMLASVRHRGALRTWTQAATASAIAHRNRAFARRTFRRWARRAAASSSASASRHLLPAVHIPTLFSQGVVDASPTIPMRTDATQPPHAHVSSATAAGGLVSHDNVAARPASPALFSPAINKLGNLFSSRRVLYYAFTVWHVSSKAARRLERAMRRLPRLGRPWAPLAQRDALCASFVASTEIAARRRVAEVAHHVSTRASLGKGWICLRRARRHAHRAALVVLAISRRRLAASLRQWRTMNLAWQRRKMLDVLVSKRHRVKGRRALLSWSNLALEASQRSRARLRPPRGAPLPIPRTPALLSGGDGTARRFARFLPEPPSRLLPGQQQTPGPAVALHLRRGGRPPIQRGASHAPPGPCPLRRIPPRWTIAA